MAIRANRVFVCAVSSGSSQFNCCRYVAVRFDQRIHIILWTQSNYTHRTNQRSSLCFTVIDSAGCRRTSERKKEHQIQGDGEDYKGGKITVPEASSENGIIIMIGFLLSVLLQSRTIDNEQFEAFDSFCTDTDNRMRLCERIILATCFCLALAHCVTVYIHTWHGE